MKKLWILTSLVVLCLNTHLTVAWAQDATGPRMVIKEKAADYQHVDEGDIIEHVFRVYNQGDQPLQIKNVKPG